MMPAMDIEPGRFAVVADPFGAVFNVIALKPEPRRLTHHPEVASLACGLTPVS